MRIPIYIIGLLLSISVQNIFAQNNLTYLLSGDRLASSPYVEPTPFHNTDIENSAVHLMRENAALFHFLQSLNDSSTYFKSRRRDNVNILKSSINHVNTSGKYLSYNGCKLFDGDIAASGTYRTNHGTIFGNATYIYRGKDGVKYNYATQPELYNPYFVGDTLSKGWLRQEIYYLKGGYGFRLGRLYYGIDALYEGIAQSRPDNPKQSNYSYWLTLGLNMAYVHRQNLYAIKVTPELNRQSISANTVSDGIRFFQFYGFGQWHRQESKGTLAYGRIQKIEGITADMLWQRDGKTESEWAVATHLSYNYRHACTEETSFKNLFELHTHRFSQQVVLDRRFNSSSLHIQLMGNENVKKGVENIYENQIQNKEQYIYDAKKVGSGQLYKARSQSVDLRAKYILPLSIGHQVYMMAAANYYGYQESYVSPRIKITNHSFSPSLGIGYAMSSTKNSLVADFLLDMRQGIKNYYSVPIPFDKFVDAHAYTPYLLRGENAQRLSMRMGYARNLKGRQWFGIETTLSYMRSDYRKIAAMHCSLFYFF